MWMSLTIFRKKPSLSSSCQQGFTLTELLISLSIVGLLLAFSVPSLIASTEERKRLANFKESILLLESVLDKYCMSPFYGRLIAPNQVYNFERYFVENVAKTSARCNNATANGASTTVTTNCTTTSADFENGSRIQFTGQQATIWWNFEDTEMLGDSVTLFFNPNRDMDATLNNRLVKPCDVTPRTADRDLYVQALGIRAEADGSDNDYQGVQATSVQSGNPADTTAGNAYGTRDGGFS